MEIVAEREKIMREKKPGYPKESYIRYQTNHVNVGCKSASFVQAWGVLALVIVKYKMIHI